MDWTPSRLEPDHAQMAIYFCRSHAGVTPPGADVKGKMNGFAALDIHPHRRYVVGKAATDKPAAATNKLCSIRTRNGLYTEFGIDPIIV